MIEHGLLLWVLQCEVCEDRRSLLKVDDGRCLISMMSPHFRNKICFDLEPEIYAFFVFAIKFNSKVFVRRVESDDY